MSRRHLALIPLCILILIPHLEANAGRRCSLLHRWKSRRCVTRTYCRPSCREAAPKVAATEQPAATEAAASKPSKYEWRSLFNGKDLTGWKVSEFGGEGDVVIEDGRIVLDMGQPMTGVTYTEKDLPTNNYEIEVEAMRVEGFDFFCCLTFPVDDSHCSFVAGGWGGSVVGISSIDHMDASENETTGFRRFDPKTWYKIRVRVTPNRLVALIDDKEYVDQDIEGRDLSTRIEVDASIPLGIAAFDTQAAIRNIRIREIDPDAEK